MMSASEKVGASGSTVPNWCHGVSRTENMLAVPSIISSSCDMVGISLWCGWTPAECRRPGSGQSRRKT